MERSPIETEELILQFDLERIIFAEEEEEEEEASIVVSLKDVTEQKQTEEALREKTHDLVQRLKELNCLYGISHIVEEPGISLREILQGTIDLIPPAWQYPEITCARLILEDQTLTSNNFNETVWKQSSDIVLHGKRLGSLEVFYLEERPESDEGPFSKEERDLVNGIAERLGGIIERRRAEDALKESEDQIRLTVENAPLGIGTVYLDGRLRTMNPAYCDMLGYSSEELSNMTFDDISHPDDREKSHKAFQGLLDRKAARLEFEKRYIHKDGSVVDVIQRGGIVYDSSGNPLFIIGISEDITEKKRLEAQLQRAQKMEALGTLAGGVAHDLNNILSGLVSYPDLLLMQLPEDSPLKKPILTIQESGQKAAAVVQDLLTLARRGVATMEVVNLNAIISEYLKSPECGKLRSFHPNVEVKTDLKGDLLNISGSKVHLSKSIMNLVSNAAEAMPGGGEMLISTESRYIDRPIGGYDEVEEGDYVVLTVSDTGVGIPTEDLERIFEPFYTKKKMGRSGTGLGMAVVWGTVKDHKGYIDIQSVEGKGTTFTFFFPVTRKELAKDKAPVSIKDYMGKGESILIVDDVKEQRDIASSILSELGYSVSSVSSGEEAVEYLKNYSADLLLLDMIMDPEIDGLETYKRILEFHPAQKAIIASGFSETDRVKEAQKLGAGKYIKKPYTLEKIGMAVKNELS